MNDDEAMNGGLGLVRAAEKRLEAYVERAVAEVLGEEEARSLMPIRNAFADEGDSSRETWVGISRRRNESEGGETS